MSIFKIDRVSFYAVNLVKIHKDSPAACFKAKGIIYAIYTLITA